MENTKNSSLAKLFPVMLCFFAMGFVDLECFPTLWDEGNPCLVLVKAL